MFAYLGQTFREWAEDKVPLLAAGLAYYTLFSIAPLLLIVIGAVGLVVGENVAQSQLMEQIRQSAGPDAAEVVQSILQNMAERGGGVIATVIGAVTLVLGATTVLAQLQNALNVIWDVRADPDKSGIGRVLLVRLMSFGVILLLGLLLIGYLFLTAALGAAQQVVPDAIPGSMWLWQLADVLLTLALITVLFAVIFKYLPDVRVQWRDVWLGAAVTALLFVIGRLAFGLYIRTSGVESAYGAAGSVIVLLLFVYYSAQILLLGAEFTQVYAKRRGARIEPADHAMRVGETP